MDVGFSGINVLVFFITFHSLKYSVEGFFNANVLLIKKNCYSETPFIFKAKFGEKYSPKC